MYFGRRKEITGDTLVSKKVIGHFSLIHLPNLGGAELAQQKLFSTLSSDYDIYVHCFMEFFMSFKRRNEFVADGVNIIQSPAGSIPGVIKNFITTRNPSCITTNLLGSELVVDIAHQHDVPVIYFSHGIFEDICGFSPMKCKQNILNCDNTTCQNKDRLEKHRDKYAKCKYIVCNSEYTKSVFMKVFPEFADKYKILYPNFDYDIFQYNDKVKDRIKVFTTNCHPLKGRSLIIDLARKYPELDIYYAACDAKTASSFMCKNIKPLGRISREEMSYHFQTSSVTLIPTLLNETFCGTAYESILCGTPVICTGKGNLVNIVNKENGAIVDMMSPGMWVDKIRELSEKRVPEDAVKRLREDLRERTGTSELKEIIDSL